MPAKRTGTGFVGLKQYLGLNSGQAADMGNRLADKAESMGGQAKGAIDGATHNARMEIARGQMPGGQWLGNRWVEGPQGYTGPDKLSVTPDMATNAAKASTYANALGTNTGRATLLGQEYKGPNTWGGNQLDAALAGAGGAGGRLANAQGNYGRLMQYLGNAQAGVARDAKAARDAVASRVNAGPTPQAPVPQPTPQPPDTPGQSPAEKQERTYERKNPRPRSERTYPNYP